MSSAVTGSGPGRWTPPTVEELQQLLPQYEIESMLGHGGMGAVYKGKQAALQRPVAIKVLPETLIGDDDDHQYVERFKLEARSMASLDHPAIISVHDFGQTDIGHLYFVMEFIDGMDIEQYIAASGGKVDPDHAVSIVSHVLDALDYAHSKGIIHRDIKPANVLINREGRVKIADFGLAKQFGGDAADVTGLTMTNMAMGTPDYIAPEAMELDSNPDQRADLYAVGVMLFRMLTGKLPRGMFKLPSEQVRGLDQRFDEIIALAMESDPEGRFQNASQFRHKLDLLQSEPVTRVRAQQDTGSVSPAVSGRIVRQSGGNPAPPVAPEPDSPEGKKGSKMLFAALASAAGIVCILAGIIATRNKPEAVEPGPPSFSQGTSTTPEAPVTQPVIAKPSEKTSKPEQSVPAPDKPAPTIASKAKATEPELKAKPDAAPAAAPPEVQELKPEPAKPIVIAIPEIEDLNSRLASYRDYRRRTTGALIIGLQNQLKQSKEESIKVGDLNGVDQADNALSALTTFASRLGNQFNENHISPLPPFTITAGTNSGTTSLLNSFRNDLRTSEIDLTGKLDQSLGICIKSLTRKDKLAEARAVRDFQSAIIASLKAPDKALLSGSENSTPGTWIDLIPLIDPIENRHIGGTASASPSHWAKKNGELVFVGENEKDEIFFPATADSPNFDILLSFTRETGVNGFDIKVPVEGGATPIGVGLRRSSAERGSLSLKGQTQGERIVDIPFFLESAKRKTIKISGRTSGPRKGITIYDGNDEYLHWAGDYRKSLGAISEYQTGRFGIRIYPTAKIAASVTTVFRFHEIRFRSLEGDSTSPAALQEDKQDSSDWRKIFNGFNLDGWKIVGDKDAFSVTDGQLIAKNRRGRPAHLFWCDEGAKPRNLKNFVLKFLARSKGDSNSGIYFHSTDVGLNSRKFPDAGHEMALSSGGSGLTANGGLFSVAAPDQTFNLIEDWFEIRMRVEGKRFQSWFNGELMLDYTESNSLPPAPTGTMDRFITGGGAIAIQANSNNGAWYFKDIQLRELGDSHSALANDGTWLELIENNSRSGWSTLRPEVWRIENGEIWKVPGAADSIKKTIPFETFELKGEFRTSASGNGGVIAGPVGELALSGSKDMLHGNVWTGGIFGFGRNKGKKTTPPTNDILDDTWIPFRIEVSADMIKTWLRGKPVSSMTVVPHAEAPHAVNLQGNSKGEVAYRNLMVRELAQ